MLELLACLDRQLTIAPTAEAFIVANGHFRIPASRNAEPADCRDAAHNSKWMRRPVRLRVLIVDDNAHFLAAAAALLERQGLHVVGVASTSDEARQLATELRPDCVLVDVDLGPESGFDVAARLVADGGYPVVLISAYTESEFSDLMAGSSAVGFISKADLSAQRIADLLESESG
jgi:CheY-like chemotaxis protein